MTDTRALRVGIDIRVADPAEPGQQRYLWRLGGWLGARGHDVRMLTVREQRREVTLTGGCTLERLDRLSRRELRRRVNALELDALLLNPERSRRYRGIPANVLRSAYGTEHYVQKLRSFRGPLERALRTSLRWNPWDVAERRWERAFYESPVPPPQVIAQSSYMRDQITGSYAVARDHIHVIHNAVDTDEYSVARRLALREEMRARWAVPTDACCLLVLAHNFRLKGLWDILPTLASAAASSDVHLLVVGRGTGHAQRAKARRLVRRLGLEERVTLAGPVRPALHAHAAADALIHLSWHDSFGFVVLEAMACGLPVVTTRFVGAAELVEDGVSGLLVDPGSRTEIADAIDRLRDPAARSAMGDRAAVVGAAHDEPGNFEQVERVLRVAAERRGRPITSRV
jgi:UDP-glucose:(heptosyl)LPS alpha-1,3-glucosyltransferase